jgi:phosphoribosylformylglycinamidine synthase
LCGLAWREPGDAIWLLGVPLAEEQDPRVSLAATSYLERLHGDVTGRPPLTDLDLETAVQAAVRVAIGDGLLASAHDLSDGGLGVAAAECCIASGLGASLALPRPADAHRLDRPLFAEGGARILVSVAPAQAAAWQQVLDAAGAALPAQRLGVVSADPTLVIGVAGAPLLQVPVSRMATVFEQAIPRRMASGIPPTA